MESDLFFSVTPAGASQVVLVVKNPPANAGDIRDSDSIPGSGRFPGGGHGNSLQYFCVENPINRGAWRASPWAHKELDKQLNTHAHMTPANPGYQIV